MERDRPALLKNDSSKQPGNTEEEFDAMIDLSLSYQQGGPLTCHPWWAGILGVIRSQLFGDELYLGVSGGGYILPEALRDEFPNGTRLYYLVRNGYGYDGDRHSSSRK